MSYPIKYKARIVVEAETPLCIGTDKTLLDQDAPVQKDWNNLPMIPGTAIAGYLRRQLNDLDKLFGDDPNTKSKQPKGSQITTSSALLLLPQENNEKPRVYHQVENLDEVPMIDYYLNLPTRQFVAINHLGASKKSALFDSEIVYKGSQFIFEIGLDLKKKDDKVWKTILQTFYQDNFYLGAGQFNNFGKLKPVSVKHSCFDLTNENCRKKYVEHTVDLNLKLEDWTIFEPENKTDNAYFHIKEFQLSGENSFFHFGSGYEDNNTDAACYQEYVMKWSKNSLTKELHYVIPGTSIKGLLAHRVAFLSNIKEENFVEKAHTDFFNKYKHLLEDDKEETLEQLEDKLKQLKMALKDYDTSKVVEHLSTENKDVQNVFGTAKNDKNSTGASGNVIVNDIYLSPENVREHICMHNKIDRFTGGTIDTALYSETVLAIDQLDFKIKIKKGFENDHLNQAIDDLRNGRLLLGGKTSKGHGFTKPIEKK